MNHRTSRRIGLLLLGAGLALAPMIAEAGGRAPRGGGSGGAGGTKVSRTATRSAAPRSTATTSGTRAAAPRGGKQTASGTATYGHGHGYGYYPGYPGYWPGYYPGYYPGYWDPWYWDYWPYGWNVGVTFGWPYFSYGAYAPYPYAYPPEPPPVEVGPASIEIDVRPSSARVLWNGEEVGRAKDYDGRWDRLRVPGGRQWLELSADGYKTLRVAIDAQGGGSYRLAYALERGAGMDPRSQDPAALPAVAEAASPPARLEKGFLRLNVAPGDAAVYLDGEYFARGDEVARLRGAIPLAVGEHRIEVVRPGFAARTVVVNVDRGATATASVELAPAD